MKEKLYHILLVVLITLYVGNTKAAYDMEISDINAGGGHISSSPILRMEYSIGQFTSGMSSSSSYGINSGFQQETGGTFISIDLTYPSGTEVTMDEISGVLSGETSNGYVDVTVTTDYEGYNLAIKSTTSPALACDHATSDCQSGDAFADYTPIGGAGVPDYDWLIATTDSEFGFTAKGDDIVNRYRYTGLSACGVGGDTDITGNFCWDALTTATDNYVSYTDTPNAPGGTDTRVKFRAQVGSDNLMPSGTYKAEITFTAISNE